MEYRGYIVFNAFQIRGLDIEALEARLVKRWEELEEGKGWVSGEKTREVFREEALSLLLPGVETQFPVERLDKAFEAETWAELDKDTFVMVVEASLQVLGEDLEAKPVVASRLDGSVIRELIENDEDFAKLAEKLFYKLDVDEDELITRAELEPALLQIEIEFGVPKSSEKSHTEALLDELFKKHGEEGSQNLGPGQFVALLLDMLLDLADTLEKNPVLSVHHGLDPNKWTKTEVLEEVMADQEKVDEITEGFYKALDVNQDGRLQKEELKPFFLINKTELPTLVADQQALEEINIVFPEEDEEVPGEVSKTDFKAWLECTLHKYVTNAKAAGV